MRRWMALSLMAVVVTSTAFAQDARLRRLVSGDDARGWEAVGRLNLGDSEFCTGALIAPDTVLTAAHCLYSKTSGDLIDTDDIEFLAGWRGGRASAYRSVKLAVAHPQYVHGGDVQSNEVRNDLALLKLDHAIRDGKIKPYPTAARPRAGAQVAVVSYGKGRSEAPSLQELCSVMAQQEGVLVTSCTVDFGSSGAPIFVVEDGKVQIVSVVSAKAKVDGKEVSLGTSLGAPLELLRAELVAQADAVTPRVRVGETNDTGAKFVKP